MTRSELISRLAAHFPQLKPHDSELVVKAILDKLSDQIANGGRVEIRGFGSFSLNQRPPRLGRNPKTGKIVSVPAKQRPHFKPGIELKERVNDSAAAQRKRAEVKT
jgi:integration host factor subunit beta